MKRLLLTTAFFGLSATLAQAAAIERTFTSSSILFEEGRYVELSLGTVNLDSSGRLNGLPVSTGGGVMGNFNTYILGLKYPVTPDLDVALVLDQPVGADVSYPSDTYYPLAGTRAKVRSNGATLMARYKFNENFSIYGGLRVLRTSGHVNLNTPRFTYGLQTDSETDLGWLAGVAYEIPEYAVRVALTYTSPIDHDFGARDTFVGDTRFTTTIPKSVQLEFQTGIAPDWLAFGSIRWVEWSKFDINPPAYNMLTGGPLVGYEDDTTTVVVGIGHKFNETWSGAVLFGYETAMDGYSSNLGPPNGRRSIGLAGTYTHGPMKVTAGLSYLDMRDSETNIGGAYTATFNQKGLLAAMKVGYAF